MYFARIHLIICFDMKSRYLCMNRGVRSRGAQCAYAPPVSKQVGHMPPCEYAPPEI